MTGFIGGGVMNEAVAKAKAEKAERALKESQAAKTKRRADMSRQERWSDGQWTEYTTKHMERIKMESKTRLVRVRAVKNGATKKMLRKVGEAAEQAGLFALLDQDGDGLVSVTEIVEGLGVSPKVARKLLKKHGGKAAKEEGGMTAEQVESKKAAKSFAELAGKPENAMAGAKAEAEEYRKGLIELAIRVELYPQISKKERLAQKLREAEEAKLLKDGEMFRMLDKDGDGLVTVAEIVEGLGVSEKEAAKILKKHGGKAAIDGGGMTADQVMDKKSDKALKKLQEKKEKKEKKESAKKGKQATEEAVEAEPEVEPEVVDAVEALIVAVEQMLPPELPGDAELGPVAPTPAQLMLRELELREEMDL